MASCASPTTAARTNLWSFNKTRNVTPTFKNWPNQGERLASRITSRREEVFNGEELDFAKLESDIIKNVLGEEEKRLDLKQDEIYNTFPSFNYVPPTIPHSFLKSNPILKLYPRDVLSSMNFHDKPTDCSPRPRMNTFQQNKHLRMPSERHRLHFPEPLPQIPEMQNLNQNSLMSERKFAYDRPYTDFTLPLRKPVIMSGKAPRAQSYQFTRAPGHVFESPTMQDTRQQNCFHTFVDVPAPSSNLYNPRPALKTEVSKIISPTEGVSIVCNEPKKQNLCSSNNTGQNFLGNNASTKIEENNKTKALQEETVKTFAQIVAASRPAPHSKADYRYHE